ncbi:MAG: hypothetical protein ACUVST_12500, partial [Anaerolineae bacterium]
MLRAALFGFLFVVLSTGALVMRFPPGEQVTLSVGDVSPTDIRSPRQRTFISEVLTVVHIGHGGLGLGPGPLGE